MNYVKYILIIFTIILSSFYLFPFSFIALPGVNTKMAMAAFSLIILLIKFAKNRVTNIDRSFIELSVLAILVSIICVVSVVFNNTKDFSYATYVVSMWVWLGGAYTLVSTIQAVHGRISVRLLCDYLIIVCVIQCVLAILIDQLPSVKAFVNSHVGSFGFNSSVGASEYERRNRLYGIGAALDFAGTRFSAVLIMIAAIISRKDIKVSKGLPLYIVSFIIIVLIGNMIARTTLVGTIIAILYLLFKLSGDSLFRQRKLILWGSTLLSSIIIVSIVLYNSSPVFKGYIEFGFEGFFSLAKTGEWQTNSGDILVNMIKFPETIKTWLIGDGYFENPSSDIYYVGYPWKGFYMGTDVGYLRFIFYFGIIGLLFFVVFFCRVAKACGEKHPQYRSLFNLLLVLNFIIWLKISTDIFVVFAPFLCFSLAENEESEIELQYENPISDSLDM